MMQTLVPRGDLVNILGNPKGKQALAENYPHRHTDKSEFSSFKPELENNNNNAVDLKRDYSMKAFVSDLPTEVVNEAKRKREIRVEREDDEHGKKRQRKEEVNSLRKKDEN